jgi:hypothetical protein
MEFIKWTQRFSEFVDDWFSDLATEPGNFDRYAEQMEEARNEFAEHQELPEVRAVIAFYDLEVFEERYDDYPSNFSYRNAYSLPEGYQGLEQNTVFMAVHEEFSERASNWKAILKYATLHELGHQVYFSERGNDVDMDSFERMVFEGHAMYLAEMIAQENGYEIDYPFLELPDVEYQDVRDELPKRSSGRGDTSEDVSQLFSYGGEKFSDAEGYPLSYNVARELVESRGYMPHEMVTMDRKEMENQVLNVLENLL